MSKTDKVCRTGRGKIEDLGITGRIPGSRARDRQREKCMYGIRTAVANNVWQSMDAYVCRGTAVR